MSHISDLPIMAQIRYVIDAWEREKKARSIYLHGKNKESKMEEALMCIEVMENLKTKIRED